MSNSIACIDYRNGKVFIAKRQNKGDMGGRWEFPGGKIEPGESFAQAITREMKEEFNINVQIGEKIASSAFEHKGTLCNLDAFLVRFEHDGIAKPFTLTEHTEYKWVMLEEIPGLNFVDSDLKIFPDILSFLKGKE